MTPHTNILISTTVTGPAGTATGDWFAVPRDARGTVVVAVNISAGSGNVVVEGRIDANTPTQAIDTFTASKSESVVRFPQMRVTINGATGLTAVTQIDVPVKLVE